MLPTQFMSRIGPSWWAFMANAKVVIKDYIPKKTIMICVAIALHMIKLKNNCDTDIKLGK